LGQCRRRDRTRPLGGSERAPAVRRQRPESIGLRSTNNERNGASMPRRIVDISVALTAGIASDPPYMLPSITYLDHKAGADNFVQVFGVRRDQLPDGAGPAVEQVAISTHNGTHLDAPYHFHPTMDNGKPALTIDEVPLEWCFNDAVRLDFRDKPDGHVCSADDVKRALDKIGYALKPLDIVLMNTSAGAAYGQPDFLDRGCGFG